MDALSSFLLGPMLRVFPWIELAVFVLLIIVLWKSRKQAQQAQASCERAHHHLQEETRELAANQERLSVAQRFALVGTFEWDLTTGTGFWSPELELLYGLEPNSFDGTLASWLAMVHQEDRDRVREAAGQTPDEKGMLDAEWRIFKPDGSLRWVAGRAQVLPDARGRPARMIGVNIDITDRKRIEEELRESEQKFRTLAENANAAFGIVQGTRFVYANRYFAELSGYTVEEILTMDFVDMVHPDFRPMMVERARRRQMGEPVPNHYEFMMVGKKGITRWIDFSPAAMTLQGKPAIIGTGFDITQRKEMETELRKAKEEAERASRSKDEFLAVLSHELRTPLTPVVTAIALMRSSKGLSKQEQDLVEIAGRNVGLETRLIDDLLDLTRIAKGKISLNLQQVDICSVLQHALAICQPDIEAAELQVHFEIPKTPVFLKGDAARLHQVIWNIVKNAVKFTPVRGHIEIRCYPKNSLFVVEVNDTGIGFEPENAELIFNSFEQREAGRQFGGLGLGLAISKRLVEMHGGTITAESTGKGRGARFRIELPLAKPLRRGKERLRPVLYGKERREEHSIAILLVEDNRDTAYLMETALNLMGHKVKTAGTVSEALELAAQQSFDLLISDIGLPDRSGFELLKDLRAKGQHLKAIALSGFGRQEDIDKSLDAGFLEHITKPVELQALHDVVDRVA